MTISVGTEILQGPDIRLLGQRLLNKQIVGHARLWKGRNSRCYQFQCAGGENYVLKFYFQSVNDPRDRLGVEFKTLSFLWNNGVHCVPQAIVMDRESRSAVYQYVPGAAVESKDLRQEDIDELVEFLESINQLRTNSESSEFGPASEACFSIGGVIASVENRLARFDQVVSTDKALADFLNSGFKPLFTDVQKWIRKANIGLAQELDKKERILSPSDVGFHNALREGRGKITFLDLEYFGWDDPAKLIADFILHPAVEPSDDLKAYYAHKVLRLFPEQKMLKERTALVYPLFGLKWCLILLNEFLRDDSQRRHFASHGAYDPAAIQEEQLEKARKMQQKIRSTYQRCPFLP